ncbi:Bug family tripartite tricarboxylate transporter substrate binding protein [Faunimonas sp. B44]|uniref:Bug family tripartite tricarboxylate transporter substrate binding protein n=1 Tax=Faunimonas sp. B44 TaxID=3461493 RepID=UPI004044C3E3
MKRIGASLAVAMTALLGAGQVAAQEYPSRTVEVIVPFAAGGGADASQRLFNKFAEPMIGQSMVVLNKPGAGGTTGWAELVRAEPDGYTLAIVTPPFNIIPALVKPKQTGYTLDQFTNICVYAVVPDVLFVREDSEFKTLQDLVDHAKANPEKVKVANSGTLGADFMTTLLIENATGTKFTQIPFDGGSKMLQGTLAGTTDAMVGSNIFAFSQKGQLRPLAIATEERDPQLADVPTFKELGYPVVSERYRALAGPPGMSAELVSYWADICEKVVGDPAFQEESTKVGLPAEYRGPEQAQASIETMTRDIEAVVQANKLAE